MFGLSMQFQFWVHTLGTFIFKNWNQIQIYTLKFLAETKAFYHEHRLNIDLRVKGLLYQGAAHLKSNMKWNSKTNFKFAFFIFCIVSR